MANLIANKQGETSYEGINLGYRGVRNNVIVPQLDSLGSSSEVEKLAQGLKGCSFIKAVYA